MTDGPSMEAEIGEVYVGISGGSDEELDDIADEFYFALEQAVDAYLDEEDIDIQDSSYR